MYCVGKTRSLSFHRFDGELHHAVAVCHRDDLKPLTKPTVVCSSGTQSSWMSHIPRHHTIKHPLGLLPSGLSPLCEERVEHFSFMSRAIKSQSYFSITHRFCRRNDAPDFLSGRDMISFTAPAICSANPCRRPNRSDNQGLCPASQILTRVRQPR